MNEKITNVIKDIYSKTRNSSIKEYSNNFTAESIQINFKPCLGSILVFADKTRIFQVLSNFINNAKKFSDGKPIDISVDIVSKEHLKSSKNFQSNTDSKNNEAKKVIREDDGERAVAVDSIKDNGKGIDKDILPRLFDKFVTSSSKGTGLGLYISKKIIAAHGGQVWAYNNYNGKGSTFISVYLFLRI